MSFPQYPEYKDSGVNFIGNIPKEWSIKKLCDISLIISGYPFESSSFLENGIPLIRMSDFREGKVFHEDIKYIQSENVPDVALGKKDDVLIGLSGSIGNYALIKESQLPVAINQRVGIIRGASEVKNILPWLVQSSVFKQQIESQLPSTTIQNISMAQLRKIKFSLPNNMSELMLIANFLKVETEKIDSLIAEQRKLIELLKEKRQAVISHAVTKGLDLNAKMKDSGIKWLGEVPEHWDVKCLRHIARIVRGASPRPAGDPLYFDNVECDVNTPWVTVAEITKDQQMYLNSVSEYLTPVGVLASQYFESGTVMFTNSGATLGVPKILDINCCANDGVLAFRKLSKDVCPEFLYYFLSTTTDRLRTEMKQGGGQPNLNTDIVKNIGFALPSINEQTAIVEFLNNQDQKNSLLIVEANLSIDILNERRSALISAAVTGQIDVRNAVTNLEAA